MARRNCLQSTKPPSSGAASLGAPRFQLTGHPVDVLRHRFPPTAAPVLPPATGRATGQALRSESATDDSTLGDQTHIDSGTAWHLAGTSGRCRCVLDWKANCRPRLRDTRGLRSHSGTGATSVSEVTLQPRRPPRCFRLLLATPAGTRGERNDSRGPGHAASSSDSTVREASGLILPASATPSRQPQELEFYPGASSAPGFCPQQHHPRPC